MKKWTLALCAVLLLIGCSAADLVSSGASSQAVSHAVSIPDWMEEDYQTTGKYDFRVPEETLVEYIMAVPDFLDASQQSLYAAAIEAYRAFAVKPGFRPDESQTYPTDLPYNYVRETAFSDSADLADYLRSLFDFELFQQLHRAYVPVDSSSVPSDGAALVGQSLYAEFDGSLYVLDVGQDEEDFYPYPVRFELVSRTEDEIVFESCYEDGACCTLCMTNTEEGWRFSKFSTPYDGQLSVFW